MKGRGLRVVAFACLGIVVAIGNACSSNSAANEVSIGDEGGAQDEAGNEGTPDGDTERLTPPCSCNGHGVCALADPGTCACDEGFSGADCSAQNADYGRRLKIADNLADPCVLKIDDDHFVLSGTGPRNEFTFLESKDLVTWTKGKTYDPSQKDPTADYCFTWAPDIVEADGKLYLYFSAHRGPKGATTCPPPAGSDVTTYRAVSESGSFDFGKPEPLFPGTTGPRTYASAGCPPEGCSRAIRIDPTVHDGRLYYVFFSGGNNIASVSMQNSQDVRVHAGPAAFTTNPFEEKINEGPALLERNGHHYLFFSAAFFNSQYATFYVMGTSPAELTRNRPLFRLTTPVRRKNGTLVETHGHNFVTTRRGEVFNFYHVGVFDGAGALVRRDTWRQRIAWRADGTAMSQNEVRVSWNAIGGGSSYSLDLVLRDGSVIGPCINAGTIGQATSSTFVGICPDAGDRLVHKSEIREFRLYASPTSTFKQVGHAVYDGYTDEVTIVASP